ncbi:hypothetical protein LCGC14_2630040, partial [marine sediment metagenome]
MSEKTAQSPPHFPREGRGGPRTMQPCAGLRLCCHPAPLSRRGQAPVQHTSGRVAGTVVPGASFAGGLEG